MNKKLTFLFVLTLITAILLSACSGGNGNNGNKGEDSPNNGGSSSSGEKVKLTLWYWNGAISDSTVEEAKTKFPNIELNAQKLPPGGEYMTKLKTSLAGGAGGPDVTAMDSWITELIQYSDKFVNLNDYGAADLKDQYLEWKWNVASAEEGKVQIAMPIDVAPTVMFYREDLFKQAGVPSTPEEIKEKVKTWDDFIALSKTVHEKTKGGMATIVDIYRNVIGQMPKRYFDETGNFIGEEGHVKQAWDTAVKAYQSGATFGMSSSSESNAALNNGTMASLIGPSWMKGDIISAAPDTKGKWRIAYPAGGVGNQGGSFFGALKTTKHPEEAAELIKFLTNAENLKKGFVEFGNYPSTPGIYEDEDMKQPDEFFGGQSVGTVFGEAAKDVVISYSDPRDGKVEDAIIEQLSLVDTNKKDSEAAWNEALENVKRELSR
ncbi:ABC transporter substrate-binding protein [Paenibacillus sp. PL91]|uniref:ABC transporter substrate-binding protein n=1 Tax=Paenibacillus sp. PL91 TaxID=2729538 RepID=UPI00145F95F6|nr:extracellular solute-binding protein [Paenibacillus sp. PL91]MBC9200394.1 extracellular solute-binding protein [Paenibacillus sp. PL91]